MGLVPATARAQDSGAFVVRLGKDTTSVERFTLTGSRLEVDQAGRAPRTLHRHGVVTLDAGGAVTAVDVVIAKVGAPADAAPLQHLTARFTYDSAYVESRMDTTTRKMSAAVPAGAGVPVISPWVMYDLLSMRLAAGKADSLHVPIYYLGGPQLSWVALRKLGRDSIDIEGEFDRYHASVDAKGRLQAVRPIHGTQQFSVDRVATLDVAAYATDWAAREQQGGPLGQLSPRDTVTTRAAGATLWVDYGRPSVRGRTIFGTVVPWDTVWRTGANAATQFRTDKALAFGSVIVPAGFYTLWTIPSQHGWTLVFNSQTGQWGTEHDASKDLYRVPMTDEWNRNVTEQFLIHVAPDDQGGQIHFAWDHTVAGVNFTVQP
jgi:hypothetical protein